MGGKLSTVDNPKAINDTFDCLLQLIPYANNSTIKLGKKYENAVKITQSLSKVKNTPTCCAKVPSSPKT